MLGCVDGHVTCALTDTFACTYVCVHVSRVLVACVHVRRACTLRARTHTHTRTHTGKFGFFGGIVEEGETLETTLQRELREELNYQRSNPQTLHPTPHTLRPSAVRAARGAGA